MTEKISTDLIDVILYACGDVQLHDEQDMMSYAHYSLSKKKRLTPIKYTGLDKNGLPFLLEIRPHPDYGMATIWDFDIVMYAISHFVSSEKAGVKISNSITVRPYHLLKSIGRHDTGSNYQDLLTAFKRLQSTVITNTKNRSLKSKKQVYEQFSFIQSLRVDEKTNEITFALCDWIFDSIIDKHLLAISPDYFKITSGIGRHLYKIARKHAGNQTSGWWFSFETLYKKCGSTDLERKFKSRVKVITEKNNLPEYWLTVEKNLDGTEGVALLRRDYLPFGHEGNKGILRRRKKISADSKVSKKKA